MVTQELVHGCVRWPPWRGLGREAPALLRFALNTMTVPRFRTAHPLPLAVEPPGPPRVRPCKPERPDIRHHWEDHAEPGRPVVALVDASGERHGQDQISEYSSESEHS